MANTPASARTADLSDEMRTIADTIDVPDTEHPDHRAAVLLRQAAAAHRHEPAAATEDVARSLEARITANEAAASGTYKGTPAGRQFLRDARLMREAADALRTAHAQGVESARNDPMTFCVCESGESCKYVEDPADGDVETCWYCTFLDGEAVCPVEAEDAE